MASHHRSRQLGPARSHLRTWQYPTFIRSVQRNTIVLNNVTSNTATITAVDLTNAVVRYLGQTFAVVTAQEDICKARIELTNATTVTAYVNTANANNLTVSFDVTEYWPGLIRKLQRGTIAVNGTGTLSPAVLDIGRCSLDSLGYTSTATDSSMATKQPYLVLTNTTTVTGTATTTGAATVGYQVVEWL